MNNYIVVASEVRINPAGQEGRASRHGKVKWVNCDYDIYHRIIDNIQGVQDERFNVKVYGNHLLHHSVRIQLDQLLLLAVSLHLYRPPEELALDQCGIHGSIENTYVVPNGLEKGQTTVRINAVFLNGELCNVCANKNWVSTISFVLENMCGFYTKKDSNYGHN